MCVSVCVGGGGMGVEGVHACVRMCVCLTHV